MSTPKRPIYYSTYVNVPITFGANTIEVAARSSNGKTAQWPPIKIQRTSPASARILALGISEYEDLDPVRYGVTAARRVADSLSKKMTQPSERHSVVVVTDNRATQDTAIDEVEDLWSDAAPDDRLVFYFAGRLAVVPGRSNSRSSEPRVYLAMSDASSRTPGLGSLSVSDLNGLLQFPNSVALLDVCVDEEAGEIAPVLAEVMPSNAVAHIGRCNAESGRLADEAVAWVKSGAEQRSEVSTLVPWVRERVASAVVGEAGEGLRSESTRLSDSAIFQYGSKQPNSSGVPAFGRTARKADESLPRPLHALRR